MRVPCEGASESREKVRSTGHAAFSDDWNADQAQPQLREKKKTKVANLENRRGGKDGQVTHAFRGSRNSEGFLR